MGDPVSQYRYDFIAPGEFIQQEYGKCRHDGIAEHSLNTVCDHQCQRTAHADNADRHDQTDDNNNVEDRNFKSPQLEILRHSQIVDEKTSGNGRHDHIRHYL